MQSPDRDMGIICVLLKRLEVEILPELLALKARVDAGGILNDGDLEYLHRRLEQAKADRLEPMLEKHPEYQNLVCSVFALYRQIIERGIRNQEHAAEALE